MTHEQERACNSVLRVFTPTDITTFYYASLVTWLSDSLKKSSLNHTWFETKLRAISPAKVGETGKAFTSKRQNLDCLESFKTQKDKVQDTGLLRAELCDNEVMHKGTAAATLPAPAPPPRQGSTGWFGNTTKQHGSSRNPTHSKSDLSSSRREAAKWKTMCCRELLPD